MTNIATDRNCGDCTACCDGWLTADINGQKLSPGSPCPNVSSQGCEIYETRPHSPCRTFKCHWLLDSSLPSWLRPSKSKVILKPDFLWNRPSSDLPVYIALSAGPKIPGKTKSWLRSFAMQRGLSIICIEPVREGKKYVNGQHTYGIGSPDFEKEIDYFLENEYEILIKKVVRPTRS